MAAAMKLELEHLNIRSLEPVNAWMEQQLRSLGELRRIDLAHVRLIRLHRGSPAYQVQVELVTPGPDYFAEARDHTLPAAFAKVMNQLRGKIGNRLANRLGHLRKQLAKRGLWHAGTGARV